MLALCSWGAAGYVLQQHLHSGPAEQSINVRWAPQTSELARLTAERALKLRDGEEPEPGKWVYHLQDHSRDAVRRVVTHPLVADTSHIDRQAFRIQIDAPAVPVWLRRVLAADGGPALAFVLAIVGLVVLWPARRELRSGLDYVRAVRGLDLALALLMLTIGFGFFYDNGQGVDENIHYDQIARLARGDWSLHPSLTMVPGFHALVAAVEVATGGVSEVSVRVVVFLLSVATVVAFHVLARTLQPDHAGTRTLQFTLLPMLFPQFFLVYTDVASLLFVVLMMLASARRHYWSAGVLGLVACLMRQNNVLWVAFAMLWSYLRESGWTWPSLIESLKRYWTFIATGAVFLLFVAANGGEVALGEDAGSHPLGSVHLTNLFFLLFLCCFLFLPLWWGYRRAVLTQLLRQRTWLALLVLAPIFWFGFINDHPHNLERASYFLPNAVLIYFSSTPWLKAAFFLPIAIAAVGVSAVPMKTPWWLLLPFSVLFLVPEWLVVPRYYLIPLTFFLVAREPAAPPSAWSERFQTVWFAAASLALFAVVERGWGWV